MNGQGALPYATWLADFRGPIVLFTLGRDADEAEFAHVERFDPADGHGLLELRALELSERFTFTHIFAQSEHDILRAAQLRDRWCLPGQSYESALAYRDKVKMKTLARAAGIATPDFKALTTPLDLYDFIQERGFPCVVKPRTGAGSRGVHVLRTLDDAKAFLRRPFSTEHMVEAFVDGDVFHVDGLAADRRILFGSASWYVRSCLAFQSGESTGSVLLDPAQPVSQRLLATTQRLLAALPSPTKFAFHAELFIDANDRILLCEVACRPGGSRTADPIEAAYGVNLYEQWVRRSFDLPIELPPSQPWLSVGRLLIPPRRGRLRAMPDAVPFGWVNDYRPNSTLGQRWDEPDFCNAHIASFILSGPDTLQVEARMRQLDDWFREQVEWEESPVTCPA